MTFDIVLFTDLTGQFYHNKPVGAYSLASVLRSAGFSVMVVDHFQRYLKDRTKLVEVIKKTVGTNTLFVGFSSTFFTTQLPEEKTIDNWHDFDNGQACVWPHNDLDTVRRLLDVVRRINPHTKIVYGGIRATRQDLFDYGIGVDYVIHGYAEISAVNLARHLRYGEPLQTEPLGSALRLTYDTLARGYDFSQHQTRYEVHDILLPGETLALETSRGCMYDCAFCDFPLRNRKRDDASYHIQDQYLSEYFVRNWQLAGITNYMLTDDTFNETTDKLTRFRNTVRSTGLPLRFMCFARLDLLARYPEQIDLLVESGVISIWLGIESLHLPAARSIGKTFTTQYVDQQLRMIRARAGPDFRIYCSFMVGLPHDTVETVTQWSQWAIDNHNIDCIQISAYGISEHSTPWPSEVSTNMQKFGYTKIQQGWQNQTWNYQQASDLAHSIQQHIWQSGRNKLAAFHLFGMLSLGYAFDEIKNITIDRIDFVDVSRRIQQQFSLYHQTLLHTLSADVAQSVAHLHGKQKVPSSILGVSTN